ncbi:MAG: histidine phosphatase family protein, partial [Oscillospiraceae bacterium]|nr:histidine phosphatase family protein [Oscillospiraceae bacterium]
IAAENDGKTIAVVSHGCAIRSVLSGIINGAEGGVENVPHGDNTSVSKIIFSGGVPSLEYINDASHLDEETSTFSHQVWWKNGTTFDSSNMYFEPMTEEILALLPGADRDMAAGSRAALVRGVPSGFVRFSGGEIEYLYMHPDLRGTSMSNQLIGEVIYASRLEGIKTLTAHVSEDTIKCADVLLRCGFEPAGGGKYVKDIAIDND